MPAPRPCLGFKKESATFDKPAEGWLRGTAPPSSQRPDRKLAPPVKAGLQIPRSIELVSLKESRNPLAQAQQLP